MKQKYILNWKYSNGLRLENGQQESCSTRQDVELCSSDYFVWVHLVPQIIITIYRKVNKK